MKNVYLGIDTSFNEEESEPLPKVLFEEHPNVAKQLDQAIEKGSEVLNQLNMGSPAELSASWSATRHVNFSQAGSKTSHTNHHVSHKRTGDLRGYESVIRMDVEAGGREYDVQVGRCLSMSIE